MSFTMDQAVKSGEKTNFIDNIQMCMCILRAFYICSNNDFVRFLGLIEDSLFLNASTLLANLHLIDLLRKNLF